MNHDTMGGNWKRFRGRVREQWRKLTDSGLDRAAGKRDRLVGRIGERCGRAGDEAEREADGFLRRHRPS